MDMSWNKTENLLKHLNITNLEFLAIVTAAARWHEEHGDRGNFNHLCMIKEQIKELEEIS